MRTNRFTIGSALLAISLALAAAPAAARSCGLFATPAAKTARDLHPVRAITAMKSPDIKRLDRHNPEGNSIDIAERLRN